MTKDAAICGVCGNSLEPYWTHLGLGTFGWSHKECQSGRCKADREAHAKAIAEAKERVVEAAKAEREAEESAIPATYDEFNARIRRIADASTARREAVDALKELEK